MNSLQKTILTLFCIFVFTGMYCVTPMGVAPSNIPLSTEQIEAELGRTEGTSTAWSFSPLCLFSLGHPDFDDAIRAALESSKGDALINLQWYKKDACLLLATWDKLYVSGTAVKLKPKTQVEGKRRR